MPRNKDILYILKMALLPDQVAVLERFQQFMKSDSLHALLTGAAGTGKTFMVEYLLRASGIPASQIKIAAPTNKAVSVLSGKISDDYAIATIHRLFKAENAYSQEGELGMRLQYDAGEWREIRLLVIDESSMLSEAIFRWILTNTRVKILFIGDNFQLPPVNEENSPAFTHHYTYNMALTTTKRTRDPKIGWMYDLFRGWQLCSADMSRVLRGSPQADRVATKDQFHAAIRNMIGQKSTYILAYSNERVDYYNAMARKVLFPNSKSKWCAGDRGVFQELYDAGEFTNTRNQPRYYTSDEFTVKQAGTVAVTVQPPMGCETVGPYHAQFHLLLIRDVAEEELTVLYPDDGEFFDYMARVKTQITQLAKGASATVATEYWKAYHAFRKHYICPIAYSYSFTVYKAQGSSFSQVLVDAANIVLCTSRTPKLMKKCMYTAVTRAQDYILMLW